MFCLSNGLLTHYRVFGPGDAPLIVLIHSLGTDQRIWNDVAARLSVRFQVLVYDMRGHGLSDAPSGDYTIDGLAEDLHELLRSLKRMATAVVGISVGGLVAQAFTATYGAYVRGGVFCATSARVGSTETWQKRIDAVAFGGIEAVADAVLANWFSDHFAARHPATFAGYRHMLERTSRRGYLGMCAALRDADLHAMMSAIDRPTLVIAGTDDASVPVDQSRALAASIVGAEFAVLEKVGHLPPVERPVAFAALVANFVKRLPPW